MAGLRKELDRYNRLVNLVDVGGVYLCKEVLFKKELWPTDGRDLYKHMEPLRSRTPYLIQKEFVCPPSGVTDIEKFDLTLLTKIIELAFGSKYASLMKDLRSMRNSLAHRGNKKLSKVEFDENWKISANVLEKYGFDLTLVDELRLEDNVIFITQGTRKYTFQYNYYISKILLFDINLLLFFLDKVNKKMFCSLKALGNKMQFLTDIIKYYFFKTNTKPFVSILYFTCFSQAK